MKKIIPKIDFDLYNKYKKIKLIFDKIY